MAAIERIRWQALQSGASPALSLPGRERHLVSYLRLLAYIDSATERLATAGLPAGTIVGLQVEDSLLHVVFTLALEQLGLATVSLPPGPPPSQLPLGAIISERLVANAPCRNILVDLRWLQGAVSHHRAIDRKPAADAICRVLLTSGSTGQPKAVALTHAMIEERVSSYSFVFGPNFARQSRILCCMGFGSSLGYLFMLYALEQGCMFCIPDTSIDVTCRKLALYNMQTIVASPSTLAEMWNYFHTDGGNFPQVELVLTAGSFLPVPLSENIRRDICTDLVTFYGTTETGVIASARVEALDLKLGEVGFVAPGMAVEITNLKDGTRTADGAGRIRIRCSANATGYLGDHEETREKFDGGWFYPGDLGTMADDRILMIKGRETGIVNLGGHKTTIEAIEGTLLQSPSVLDAGAVVAPDELGLDRVTAVLVPAKNWTEPGFWSYCKQVIDRPLWPIRVTQLPTLPRLPNGKLDRAALRKAISP